MEEGDHSWHKNKNAKGPLLGAGGCMSHECKVGSQFTIGKIFKREEHSTFYHIYTWIIFLLSKIWINLNICVVIVKYG